MKLKPILFLILTLASVAIFESFSGRSWLGPDGTFGWWESSIWSSENSQRVADAYTFSHIIHGFIFFGLTWLFLRGVSVSYRFLIALVLEGGWEMLENSSIIINRYREATISLGYDGDSILNSCSDIVMMSLGFIFASYARLWITISIAIIFEVGCLFLVRDNLTLNVIMLVHPIQGIKEWQSEKAPDMPKSVDMENTNNS